MFKRFALAFVMSFLFIGFANAAPSDYVKKDVVTVIDLGATSCIPCKMMAPVLEKVKADYAGKAAVIFIDVWKNPETQKPRSHRPVLRGTGDDLAGHPVLHLDDLAVLEI